MFSIGFFQCQQDKKLPHMNMPLFVNDLREEGFRVFCACVNVQDTKDFLDHIKSNAYDLIGLDYLFPVQIINRIKIINNSCKIVVGGSGCLDTFVKSSADFAIIGAGRKSILQLTKCLAKHKGVNSVENLFYKTNKNNTRFVDYSGVTRAFDLKCELFPYRPELRWASYGFNNNAVMHDSPTVISDIGCRLRVGRREYAGDKIPAALNFRDFTKKARKRIAAIYYQRETMGCSFCTYYCYAGLSQAGTVEISLRQMEYLQTKYGYDRFSIGSENPFIFIIQLLSTARKRNIKIRELRLRSRADWINRNKKTIRRLMKIAVARGILIVFQQIGYESLIEDDLKVYRKGCKVKENIEAMNYIKYLARKYPGSFVNDAGTHGMIGVNPFLPFKDLNKYVFNNSAPTIAENIKMLSNKIVLYDRLLPLYAEIKKHGLLVKNNCGYDTYRYADPKTDIFMYVTHALSAYLRRKQWSYRGPEMLASMQKLLAARIASSKPAEPRALAREWVKKLKENIRKIKASKKHFGEALLFHAKQNIEKGNLDIAARTLQKLLSLNPRDGEARYLLGETYRIMDNAEKALREYGKARNCGIARDVSNKMILMYCKMKDHAAAVSKYKELQEKDKDSNLRYAVSISLMELGEYSSAAQELLKAKKLFPESADILLKLIYCYKRMGKQQQSKRLIKRLGGLAAERKSGMA